MGGEPTDDPGLAVALPPSLSAWLDERAADAGTDREELVVQLLAAYRAVAEDGLTAGEGAAGVDDRAADGDGPGNGDGPAAGGDREATRGLAAVPEDAVEGAVRDALSEQRVDIAATVTEQVDDQLAAFEREVESALEDLRRRVAQVNRLAREKADADHHHDALARLDGVAARVDHLEAAVGDERETREEALDDLRERVAELDEKLTSVARVVVRLSHEREAGRPPAERRGRADPPGDSGDPAGHERERRERAVGGGDGG